MDKLRTQQHILKGKIFTKNKNAAVIIFNRPNPLLFHPDLRQDRLYSPVF